jgi:O-antigen/teichoic acid export membrane protein
MVFAEHLMIIGVLTFAYIFMDLFSTYASNFQRVAVPELLSNLSLKVGLPILILFVYFDWWTEDQFEWGLVALYGLMALSLGLYLQQLEQWRLRIDWSFLTPRRRRSMLSYAFFGMLTALGSTLAFRIDSIMVTSLIDERTNGAYNIALFMTNTIIIPFQAINAIAGPIVADNWARKDLHNIQDIYRRSSLNLLLIGGFLFAALYLVLDDLLRISTNYEELVIIKDIVFLLGLAKVIDMTTGINNIIIGYSPAYRFNFYSILLLGVVNVLMNYLLIPRYHIVGAALATLISLLAYNLAKYLFILFRYGMQPFTWVTLKVLALGLGVYAVLSGLPRTGWPLVNLALLGGLFTLLYWIPALYWRLSPDINEVVEQFWRQLRARWRGPSSGAG